MRFNSSGLVVSGKLKYTCGRWNPRKTTLTEKSWPEFLGMSTLFHNVFNQQNIKNMKQCKCVTSGEYNDKSRLLVNRNAFLQTGNPLCYVDHCWSFLSFFLFAIVSSIFLRITASDYPLCVSSNLSCLICYEMFKFKVCLTCCFCKYRQLVALLDKGK